MDEKLEVNLDKESLTYDLTFNEVVGILETIDNSLCKELHLELRDLKLTIEKK